MIIKEITSLASDALKIKRKYNAFLGVSLNNKFFSKKTMREYILWCSEQFVETLILIMDDPERYNYIILRGMSKKDAVSKSRYLGTEMKASYEKILKQFNISNVKITLFSEFWEDKEFVRINELIEKECNNNLGFKKSSMRSTLLWVGKKNVGLVENIDEKNLNILNRHIREELASLFYLTEKGYKIELDPTQELITKKEVYDGKFLEVAKKIGITERGHLYLCPEDCEEYSGVRVLG